MGMCASPCHVACVCRQQCEAAQHGAAEAHRSAAAGGHEAGQLRDRLQQAAAEKQRLEVALQVGSCCAASDALQWPGCLLLDAP